MDGEQIDTTATDTTSEQATTTAPETAAPEVDEIETQVESDSPATDGGETDQAGATAETQEFDPFAPEPAEPAGEQPDRMTALMDRFDKLLGNGQPEQPQQTPATPVAKQPDTKGAKPATAATAATAATPAGDFDGMISAAREQFGDELADQVIKPLTETIADLKRQLGEIAPKVPILDQFQQRAQQEAVQKSVAAAQTWFKGNKDAFKGPDAKNLWNTVLNKAAQVQKLSFDRGDPLSEADALDIALAMARKTMPPSQAVTQIKGQMKARSNQRTSAPAGARRGGSQDPRSAFEEEYSRQFPGE